MELACKTDNQESKCKPRDGPCRNENSRAQVFVLHCNVEPSLTRVVTMNGDEQGWPHLTRQGVTQSPCRPAYSYKRAFGEGERTDACPSHCPTPTSCTFSHRMCARPCHRSKQEVFEGNSLTKRPSDRSLNPRAGAELWGVSREPPFWTSCRVVGSTGCRGSPPKGSQHPVPTRQHRMAGLDVCTHRQTCSWR